MKRILKFLLLLLAANNAAHASPPIWNGKADTKWYKDSATDFTITTPEQLAGLAKLVNKGNDFDGKTIKLGANIMLNDTANWQNWDKKAPRNKWKPIGFFESEHWGNIGHLSLGYSDRNYFSGTFDGNGFAVSGVYVSESGSYKGLFGYVSNGVIKNLGVTASYIKGSTYVGSLVGRIEGNYSQIINCYSKALVTGSTMVGGLAGQAREIRIINSYSTGTVTGKKEVGGLVGNFSLGQIINCYSKALVRGSSCVGGLAGYGFGNITSSYFTGTVTGEEEVGGLVGYGNSVNIISSYYCKELSSQNDNGKGEGKTTANMKRKETYEGLDFDKTWAIDERINGGYPYLKDSRRSLQ